MLPPLTINWCRTSCQLRLQRTCFVVQLAFCFVVQTTVLAQSNARKDDSQSNSTVSGAVDDLSPAEVARRSSLKRYEESIRPLLQHACYDCHSGNDVEGNFRAEELDPDLVGGGDVAWWLEVYAAISKGDMPPPDSSELSDTQRARIVDWLAAEIQRAEQLGKTNGNTSSFRRLTRYEYNYALQDLLGVPWTFARDLPAEASEADAFENNADSLHMSVKQIQTYHQHALEALRRVTVRGQRPPVLHWSIPMKRAFDRETRRLERSIESAEKKLKDTPEKLSAEIQKLRKQFQTPANRSHYLELASGIRAEIDWDYRKAAYVFRPDEANQSMPDRRNHFAVVQPGSRQALTVELGDKLPDQGTMRVRIRASRAAGVDSRVSSLQLHFGFQATDQGRSIKRVSLDDVEITAPFEEPEIYEWEIPLGEIEHRNTYRGEMKLGDQPSPSEYIRFTNGTVDIASSGDTNAAIWIDYVEVAAPVYDSWPPESHRRLFPEHGTSLEEAEYARELIASFMTRAWRHAPSDRDLERKMRLFNRVRRNSIDFHAAVIEVLATVLTSPKFLYVLPGKQQQEPSLQDPVAQSQLSQGELATRLSLFLWCSLPDEALLRLASEGKLDNPEILRKQATRMLADPRAQRFANHFVQQWLKLQPLEFLAPSRDDDGLDEALLESIKEEPIALFADMLRHNSSVLEFIESDYLVINERLANHYGVAGVPGNGFRRVTRPAALQRGGLLTQAGLLTMNSDGTDSHPVKRGVWLLTNLLNDPPPPPPPAVPEIDLTDPAIAKMTLKERIEDHRNHAACLSCHQKIDPWGIAFENYDALGRWRDKIDGKPVDATSILPSKAKLDGVKGLKEHLIEQRGDQIARATIEKLAAFALGRQLAFSDRAEITKITQQVQETGDGLQTIVLCLVSSKLFQSK